MMMPKALDFRRDINRPTCVDYRCDIQRDKQDGRAVSRQMVHGQMVHRQIVHNKIRRHKKTLFFK